jgi:putative tricarboxylic transport membrane protein
MKLRNLLDLVVWIGISIIVCLESAKVGIGNFQFPGSGFFPFWLGVILSILAITLTISKPSQKEGTKITDLRKETGWFRIILVLTSILAYIIILNKIGYILATIGLMIILFNIGERKKIWVKIVMAIIIVLTSYVIFCLWLEVQLPRGLLNF